MPENIGNLMRFGKDKCKCCKKHQTFLIIINHFGINGKKFLNQFKTGEIIQKFIWDNKTKKVKRNQEYYYHLKTVKANSQKFLGL